MFAMFGIGPIELLIVGVIFILVAAPAVIGLIVYLVTRKSTSQVYEHPEMTALRAENQRLHDELAQLKSTGK
jgi:hypothetical protein